MAILNRIYEMSTVNWQMVVVGILLVIVGIASFYFAQKTERILPFVILFTFTVVTVIGGLILGVMSTQPECQIPTGKVQIEAVFPKGKPNAYILSKYEVIEQRGRIWVLEEK